MYTLTELCKEISISPATGRNWVKLGKLVPSGKRGNAYNFSDDYVKSLKEELKSGVRKSLKSRRNKAFISGNHLYKSYVSDCSKNISNAEEILKAFSELQNKENSDKKESSDSSADTYSINLIIRGVLANAAIKTIYNSKNESLPDDVTYAITSYLEGKITVFNYGPFIDELIDDKEALKEYIKGCEAFPDTAFVYEPGEDILGLIYISMKMMDLRKISGSYYTPNTVIKKLLGHLFEAALLYDGQSKRILDPCCGTGNFLLQLPPGIPPENIYGGDIDEISVLVTRINLALKYDMPDHDFWTKHIEIKDFLAEENKNNFDIILGNPPWGSSFPEDVAENLRGSYQSAKTNTIESFDVFTEKGIRSLSDGGILAFVLPQSILNVKSHMAIRKFMLENTTLSNMEYLGEVFDHVQCPSVILQLKRNAAVEGKESVSNDFLMHTPKIYDGDKCFKIQTVREVNETIFDFMIPDDEFLILDSMDGIPGKKTLFENATFALGIVTGSNKDALKKRKSPKNEVILKGQDIYKYAFTEPKCYISFDPAKCQQCAPVEYYRAEEKLLYRFIGNRLVFSYDNKKTLSLNSCNILIPKIDGLHIKYVLAVLNSKPAEFYFRKKYRSVKVLRSHLESLPIPDADSYTQGKITRIVDDIIEIAGREKKTLEASAEIASKYDEIDEIIASLYQLSGDDYNIIKNTFKGENNFLPM